MGRHSTVEKNRVYVECTDAHRRVKAWILLRDELSMKVELPSGFILDLTKRNQKGTYRMQVGLLEFISDGKPVV